MCHTKNFSDPNWPPLKTISGGAAAHWARQRDELLQGQLTVEDFLDDGAENVNTHTHKQPAQSLCILLHFFLSLITYLIPVLA